MGHDLARVASAPRRGGPPWASAYCARLNRHPLFSTAGQVRPKLLRVNARKLVVYVEDNTANFALVCKLLEASGHYEVLGAPDGEHGLELIKARLPDVVLLDLDLPGMSGIEVAKRLKQCVETAAIPILVVTASVMRREHTSAMEAGADAFIAKPFDITELRKLVNDTCGI